MQVERAAAAVAVLLGAALLAASLRTVPAALHRHAAQAALARIAAAPAPAPERARDVGRLAHHAEATLAWRGTPGDLRRRAAAARARGADSRARGMLVRSLRRAPADAVAWTRLAALRHRAGHLTGSAAALARALRAAPSMRHLAPLRAALILRLWPRLQGRTRPRVRHRQLRIAAAAAPQQLHALAAHTGRRAVLKAATAEPVRHPRR